jgi:hypothetical protein
MLPYYYYWQASRRLKESYKTVMAMEPDVPPMVQAQYDMIEREVEYYREESDKFTKIVLCFVAVACIILVMYSQGYAHVPKFIK